MHKRALLILFGYSLLMVQASAQEDSAETADAEPIIIEAEDANASDDGDPGGAADARAEDDDERFIPSREIPPDEQVIFPVDI